MTLSTAAAVGGPPPTEEPLSLGSLRHAIETYSSRCLDLFDLYDGLSTALATANTAEGLAPLDMPQISVLHKTAEGTSPSWAPINFARVPKQYHAAILSGLVASVISELKDVAGKSGAEMSVVSQQMAEIERRMLG